MPMTEAGLKAAIIAELSGAADEAVLANFAEALAKAIVSYIQANGTVLVTGVMPGGGTAPGTIS